MTSILLLIQARVSATSFDEGENGEVIEEKEKERTQIQAEIDLISVLADQVVKETKKRQVGKRRVAPRKHREEKKTSMHCLMTLNVKLYILFSSQNYR